MITGNGTLKMSWLKKIANYQESDPVQMNYYLISGENNNTDNVTGNGSHVINHVTGSAKETSLPSLRFGEFYYVSLVDKISNETVGPFVIESCKFFGNLFFTFFKYDISHGSWGGGSSFGLLWNVPEAQY